MGGRFGHVSSPALCPCQVAQYEGEIALAAPPEHARAFTVEDPDRPLYLTHVDEQVACDLAGTQLHGDLPVQVLEVEGALQLPLVEPPSQQKVESHDHASASARSAPSPSRSASANARDVWGSAPAKWPMARKHYASRSWIAESIRGPSPTCSSASLKSSIASGKLSSW
jgi:hypothetical protein